jgi:fucose permease
VYPFAGRLQWLFASRYKHLVVACRQAPAADSLVHQRLDSLERWGKIRAVVAGFLYLGIASAIGSVLGQYIPGFEELAATLQQAAAITGAFAGLFTLIFLALTRLLSQLEIDILLLFMLGQNGENDEPQKVRRKAIRRELVADDV